MSKENKHVFDDSAPVWLSLDCDDGQLAVFQVDVPVKIDSTGAVPYLQVPGFKKSFQASVRADCNAKQLQTAIDAGVDAFQKAFNEKMEARNA